MGRLAGIDSLTLQRLMGHASLATMGRYVHLSKWHLAEARRCIQGCRRTRGIAAGGRLEIAAGSVQ
jgi:hypothetical protein